MWCAFPRISPALFLRFCVTSLSSSTTPQCVGVSSLTGEGFDELHLKIQEAAQEYLEEYKPELERRAQEKAREEEERVSKQTELLLKDLQLEEKK